RALRGAAGPRAPRAPGRTGGPARARPDPAAAAPDPAGLRRRRPGIRARRAARRAGAGRRARRGASAAALLRRVLHVASRPAVGAAGGGSFSLLDASARMVVDVAGGIAVGLAVGWVVRQVRRRLDDPPIEVAIAVLSGYFAYLPATAIGVSGVLAAVTIGVY